MSPAPTAEPFPACAGTVNNSATIPTAAVATVTRISLCIGDLHSPPDYGRAIPLTYRQKPNRKALLEGHGKRTPIRHRGGPPCTARAVAISCNKVARGCGYLGPL